VERVNEAIDPSLTEMADEEISYDGLRVTDVSLITVEALLPITESVSVSGPSVEASGTIDTEITA
jgi:hypothetical protein